MSIAKQIGIAVLATILLVIFGYGSYFASRQIFPDPEAEDTNVSQNGKVVENDAPTVSDMKKLEPQNAQVKFDENEFVLSFETVEQVGSTVYVTPNQNERVDQVMKDYRNGVAIEGRWFVIATDASPETTHIATVPSTLLSEDGEVYYYILLSYKGYWLPFGDSMSYETGPRSPFLIKK